MSMEIGDKTFFIGAILAMSNDKKLVFLGSVSALVVMCIISCVIGVTAPILMSRNVTVIIAAILVSCYSSILLCSLSSLEFVWLLKVLRILKRMHFNMMSLS